MNQLEFKTESGKLLSDLRGMLPRWHALKKATKEKDLAKHLRKAEAGVKDVLTGKLRFTSAERAKHVELIKVVVDAERNLLEYCETHPEEAA